MLRIDDPNTLGNSDLGRVGRRARCYRCLERGAHPEAKRVRLAQVEGLRAIDRSKDRVVDGRVVDLVVEVEYESVRAIGGLSARLHHITTQCRRDAEHDH